ncbi:MAG: hypothetical protein KDJ75_08075 [Alphaproteobacteria bacterium]|nr:hypothetical protein [Alphaproteobacteria bacterium]
MSILDLSDIRTVLWGATLGVVFAQAAGDSDQSGPVPEKQGMYLCHDSGGLRKAFVVDYNLINPSDAESSAEVNLEVFWQGHSMRFAPSSVYFSGARPESMSEDVVYRAAVELTQDYCLWGRDVLPDAPEMMRAGQEIHFVNTLQGMLYPGR